MGGGVMDGDLELRPRPRRGRGVTDGPEPKPPPIPEGRYEIPQPDPAIEQLRAERARRKAEAFAKRQPKGNT